MSATWIGLGHWGCVALVALACASTATWLSTSPPERATRWLRDHVAQLDARLVFLRLPLRGRHVAALQAGLAVTAAVVGALVGVVPGAVIAVLPGMVGPLIEARVTVRLDALDVQLEGWLRALSGSLASGASLGQGVEESLGLVASPLRDEVEQACREMALGTGVSESLRRMAARVHSATLSTAVAAICIGQRSGGGLPRTLRESASALREMARLEGIVRTRTAESRAQAAVVGLVPIPMVAFIHHLNPGLMAPLWEHEHGWVVVGLAVVLWVSSIVVARRILDVDI